MEVPFLTLARQNVLYLAEYTRIAQEVWRSGQVLQGKPIKDFEELLKDSAGRKHAIALSSGTDALAFSMLAAGIQVGDEVIVTSLSFIASATAIIRVGASPVFVDIEPDYYMMDLEKVKAAINPKTKAVLAVQIFGQPMPFEPLEQLCKEKNLVLIEDAAQAVGAKENDRPAGSLGALSCFSFDPMKVIGSLGSCGAVLTDDESMAKIVRMLRYHGRDPKSRNITMLGFNSQLACDKAAILSFKFGKLDEFRAKREAIAFYYLEELDCLAQAKDVVLPKVQDHCLHNWHKFVLRARSRDQLKEFLEVEGINTMVHYPGSLSCEPLMQSYAKFPEDLPEVTKFCSETISLPIFPELTELEAQYVTEKVLKFYGY